MLCNYLSQMKLSPYFPILTKRLKDNSKITICGSTRLKKEIDYLESVLSDNQHIVFTPAIYSHYYKLKVDDIYKELMEMHRKKMDMSDLIIILIKDNYIGDGLKEELEYIRSNNLNYIHVFI